MTDVILEREVSFRLTGTKPLLMSNGRMADPSDEYALKYTLHSMNKPNVRSKNVKDNPQLLYDWYDEEKRIQFFGLIYWNPGIGFHFPADNMLYMVREAFFGYGSTAKGGDRLLSILETDRDEIKLHHAGPTDPQERFNAQEYRTALVSNKAMGGAKVRVLQPLFDTPWHLDVTYRWPVDAEQPDMLGKGKTFNADVLKEKLIWQGRSFGLGAYRKSRNYGNFEVEVL